MMEEKDIRINYNDHKMLKYYTVKVEGHFKCQCGNTWSSYMATIKVDLYQKRITKIYKQACKKCQQWATPSFQLEDVMERVIHKYFERKESLDNGEVDSSGNTLVDSSVHHGNPRGPHAESLCERCQELGKPCWG